MLLADVNVLLRPFRAGLPRDDEYLPWLEEVTNGVAAYGMAGGSAPRGAGHGRLGVERCNIARGS